jgi:hypothetical protein
MRISLLLIAILFSLHSVAQYNILNIKPPTILINPNKVNIDQMPNAMTGFILRSEKMGNNGQGFDLYKSEPDNMIVLKPDKNSYQSIPNAVDNDLNNNKLNTIPPFLLNQLKGHLNDSSIQNNNEEYHFKLLKPSPNKVFLDSTQRKIIPTPPSLQR